MAKLVDLIVPSKELYGIKVKALTLSDLAQLISGNREALLTLFSGANFMDVAMQFPKMVSDLIALSTGDSTENASQLPIGIQLELIQEIWTVSQIDVELLGKIVAGILTGLQKTTKNLPLSTVGNNP